MYRLRFEIEAVQKLVLGEKWKNGCTSTGSVNMCT